MREVGPSAVPEHDQWTLAVDPLCARGYEGGFDAMGKTPAQHLPHGEDRLAADFIIGWNRVDEELDLVRRIEPPEKRELGGRQIQILTAGDALVPAASHARVSYAACRGISVCGPAPTSGR
jgi:hypothetical protein